MSIARPAATTGASGRAAPGGPGIGPLHTATISAADPAPALRFYRDALGMRARGPLDLTPEVMAAQRRLWGLPPDARWQLWLFDRPAAPGSVAIRLLVFRHAGPAIRAGSDARDPGPFALGFPAIDVPSWDADLRRAGYASMAPLERYTLPRPDGSRYGIDESIFIGPDGVRAVTVSRRDGMPQLGAVDPATGRGGPAYSTQVVADSGRVLDFYVHALGLELRSDRQWTTSEGSALGLPAGIAFRFAMLYAPGATTGHLLFLDFTGRSPGEHDVAPRPPNRGLGMWTFPVADLRRAAQQLRAAGAAVTGGPVSYDSPDLGRHAALCTRAPNGFLVELFQPADESVALH